jgi:hypothetical protein
MKTLVDEIKRRTLQDAGLTQGADLVSISADASLALRKAKLKALLGLLTAPGISWAMALSWATYRTPVSHALSEIKRQVYADMALCKELRVA